MQGLLLPLCQSGTCTLREAVIVSSVINRVSIPVHHSAAALLRLGDMPYSGTTSFFIRVLLDKKYSIPYRVVGLPWQCLTARTSPAQLGMMLCSYYSTRLILHTVEEIKAIVREFLGLQVLSCSER